MKRTLFSVAALAVLPLVVGCSTTQTTTPGYSALDSARSTFRAQSPQMPSPMRQVSYQCATGQCGPAAPMMMPGGCPSGACQTGACQTCPPSSCQSGNCASGCCGGGCGPSHRNYFTYNAPQGLRYPNPMPTPMAAVNYPYYTTKGPTDFFYKGNGKD